MEGLKGEDTVVELCRQEGISESLYYHWNKQFLEAGKAHLAEDTQRKATSDDVKEMRRENDQLKQLVAELALKNRVLKKLARYGSRLGGLMRYSQAENRETIRLVEQFTLPVCQTLVEHCPQPDRAAVR